MVLLFLITRRLRSKSLIVMFSSISVVINNKTGATKLPFSAFVTLFLVFTRKNGETHVRGHEISEKF